MKLKSLFLATLAAMAMVSCSNENDPITDNGDSQVEKNALLQFRISFGNSVNTRADETNGTQGGTEAGLDKEQKFSNALLIAAYVGGSENVIIKDIKRNEFLPVIDPENSDSDPSSTGNYYQTVPFEVPAGTVKAYVVLNPKGLSSIETTENDNGDITSIKYGDTEIKGKMAPDAVETALKEMKLTALPGTKINEESGEEVPFVMYGVSASATGEVLNPYETTAVSVIVDRVTAKLKEETPSDKTSTSVLRGPDGDENNTLNKPADEGTVTGVVEGDITVTLTNYGFTNLTNESYLVDQEAKISTFIESTKFDGKTTTSIDCTQKLGSPSATTQITYCWENENSETVENGKGIGDNITSIIYKGKISITGHTDEDENVYIYNNTVYNHKELKAALPSLDLDDTEESTIAEYDARGILKYEGGVCYYRQPILTNGSAIIKRNNVYKLKVNNILSIGYPTPIPPVKKTMMQLYITVNEWTVNVNEFNLGE